MSKAIKLSKKEAGEIVSKSCYYNDDVDSSNYGRSTLHCFLGMFGADWDKDEIMKLIAKSTEREWAVGQMMGHELGILAENKQGKCKVYFFDVRKVEYESKN